MRNLIIMACLTLASCAAASPATAAPTFPDRGRAAVVDAAGVIPDASERALNKRVVAWDSSTGHQLAIATVPSLGGETIADYGVALGRKWGLGHSGSALNSDGVILLLAPTEHKVRIEVGYGLEPVLTDALTSEIIRDQIVPRLKAGDMPGALDAGASAIMAAAAKPQETIAPAESGGFGWGWLVAGFIGVLATISLLVRRARRKETAVRAATASKVKLAGFMPPPPPAMAPRPRKRASTGTGYTPAYSPPVSTYDYSPTPTPSPSCDYGSSDSSSDSSSGFDSGGGSFGGGGSDSSW